MPLYRPIRDLESQFETRENSTTLIGLFIQYRIQMDTNLVGQVIVCGEKIEMIMMEIVARELI